MLYLLRISVSLPACSLVCEKQRFGTVPLSFSMEAGFPSDTLIFTYQSI